MLESPLRTSTAGGVWWICGHLFGAALDEADHLRLADLRRDKKQTWREKLLAEREAVAPLGASDGADRAALPEGEAEGRSGAGAERTVRKPTEPATPLEPTTSGTSSASIRSGASSKPSCLSPVQFEAIAVPP